MSYPIIRLSAALSAVCPIDGVSVSGQTARIDYAAAATSPQRAAAAAVLAAFDWSPAADTAYEVAQTKSEAASAVDAWIAQGAGATTGDRVLVAFALLVLDEINTLRGKASLPPYTTQNLIDAVKAKVAGG